MHTPYYFPTTSNFPTDLSRKKSLFAIVPGKGEGRVLVKSITEYSSVCGGVGTRCFSSYWGCSWRTAAVQGELAYKKSLILSVLDTFSNYNTYNDNSLTIRIKNRTNYQNFSN